MAQRNSDYARKPLDLYSTPTWVTLALIPHMPDIESVWEPACGNGAIIRALKDHGITSVVGTDIAMGPEFDFMRQGPLNSPLTSPSRVDIITNPPYCMAQAFVERALTLQFGGGGRVAMLLSNDFDHAKTRRHLFADCPIFAKKVTLTRRIVWFDPAEENARRKVAGLKPLGGPSAIHAWYLWDHLHDGEPTIGWGE